MGRWARLWEAGAFFGALSPDQTRLVVGANASHSIHFTQHVLKWGTRRGVCWALRHGDGGDGFLTSWAPL